MSAWLDAYPDDYTALRRLRQFALEHVPDSELQRRVVDRLRRPDTVHRRPQSAGAQRHRTYVQCFFLETS